MQTPDLSFERAVLRAVLLRAVMDLTSIEDSTFDAAHSGHAKKEQGVRYRGFCDAAVWVFTDLFSNEDHSHFTFEQACNAAGLIISHARKAIRGRMSERQTLEMDLFLAERRLAA